MTAIIASASLKEVLLDVYQTHHKELVGTNSFLLQKRREAAESFKKQGVPYKKHEEYKYTSFDFLSQFSFSPLLNFSCPTISSIDVQPYLISTDETAIVIVNGIFSPELSHINKLPPNMFVGNLSQAFRERADIVEKHLTHYADVNSDSFIALNTMLFQEGLLIHIPKGTTVEYPIHLIYITTTEKEHIIQPRALVVVEKETSATIVESFISHQLQSKTFINSLSEIVLEEQAVFNHIQLQQEGNNVFHLHTTQVYQKSSSNYNVNTITYESEWVRNNLNVALDGENSEANLYGLYFLNEYQHVDNHTLVDHRKPNCQSNELYKGVINESATGVFNGKIWVRQDAQKTNAFQSNKNILLSDQASLYTKPQLEIYANDVKCSHGSSTGRMDQEALFYLRSRGISEKNAKKLLVRAFAEDIIDTIKIEKIKNYITELLYMEKRILENRIYGIELNAPYDLAKGELIHFKPLGKRVYFYFKEDTVFEVKDDLEGVHVVNGVTIPNVIRSYGKWYVENKFLYIELNDKKVKYEIIHLRGKDFIVKDDNNIEIEFARVR